jgi:hypothetical protein
MPAPTRAQLEVCSRFNVEALSPRSDEKVGLALSTLGALPLNALRIPVEGGVCGWYIWGGEIFSEDDNFFQPMHVAHLNNYVENLLPYLALPPGWRVLLAPNQEDVWFDEALLRARTGG